MHKRESLSIASISFPSKNFTKSVHTGGSSSCCPLENAEHKTSSVFGRLVCTKCSQTNASQGQPWDRILYLLSRLGFLINTEKSNLEPTQNITYIRGKFRLDKKIVMPTPDRLIKLRGFVTNLMGEVVSARQYLPTLGVMASCIEIIPNARLYMMSVQIHVLH